MWYALLTILFSLVGLYVGCRGYAVVKEVSNWPTVPGRILEKGGRGAGRYYAPDARHSYSVAGTDYESDQVYPIPGTQGLASAMQKVVDALPETVDVH